MLRKMFSAVLASIAIFLSVDAHAHITEIRIDSIEPFANGHAFAGVGAYEKIKGVAKGELDPKSPQNAVIVDLDKAPVNARGMVEYETDIYIMRPADPAKGSGIILYEVNNRGWKFLWSFIQDATTLDGAGDPQTLDDIGNGFAFERGYTLVWSGWDPETPAAYGALATRVPFAIEDGKPIVRRIRDEFDIGTRVSPNAPAMELSYPAVTLDKAQARLAVRARQADARTEIPAARWEYVDAQTIRLLPAGTRFTPLSIYEFWYPATGSKVVGIGFAATRDLVSFLRHARADRNGMRNPVSAEGGKPIEYALAVGISQSGRFLRHYLDLGMNKDEDARPVFDGVLAHVAGVGKTFANHSFAEPGRTATQHEEHDYPERWFPFSSATTTDPFSGKTGSLLEGHLTDPLLIETNTSSEYWQKGASLLHIDPTGTRDLRLPPRTRAYLIAGTQHGGRAGLSSGFGPCANPTNPHNPAPALRALLVALEEWVTDGVEPPASRVPLLAAGTAVDAGALRMPVFRALTPAQGANRIGPPVDWVDPPAGPEAAAAPTYAIRVAAVDADGNEVAGIRLPPIAVPLATHTGWNVYRPQPGELCDLAGSYIPFAKTKAEREAIGDPRPSLEERYGSRAIYVSRIRTAADALMRERLLLPADADAYVQAAATSDRF
jgi:hypothetical protein